MNVVMMFAFLNVLSLFQGVPNVNTVGVAGNVYLTGRVYRGETGIEPPNADPLEGVQVEVYCSNNQNQQGTYLTSTNTGSDGYYSLEVSSDDPCEYFNIIEHDPTDYISNGATTVSGSVVTANWIQYQWNSITFDGRSYTGNKFWDDFQSFSGYVYEGDYGATDVPLGDVLVSLFVSNDQTEKGVLVAETFTDESGYFLLKPDQVADYYNIVENDPDSYYSVGANTADGSIVGANWIQYTDVSALNTSVNNFWDKTERVYLPFVRLQR